MMAIANIHQWYYHASSYLYLQQALLNIIFGLTIITNCLIQIIVLVLAIIIAGTVMKIIGKVLRETGSRYRFPSAFLGSLRRIWEKHKTIRYKPDNREEEEKLKNRQKSFGVTSFCQRGVLFKTRQDKFVSPSGSNLQWFCTNWNERLVN